MRKLYKILMILWYFAAFLYERIDEDSEVADELALLKGIADQLVTMVRSNRPMQEHEELVEDYAGPYWPEKQNFKKKSDA